jgi:predicted nucleotidyltransferase
VIAILNKLMEPLRSACRRHRVVRLEVFGSAVDADRFDPNRSDIDFIVSFSSGADLGP